MYASFTDSILARLCYLEPPACSDPMQDDAWENDLNSKVVRVYGRINLKRLV